MSASLALYALVAIPSLFILLLMLFERTRGAAAVEKEVLPFLGHWIDPRWADLIRHFVVEVQNFDMKQSSVTVSSVIVTAIGMGGFALQLRNSIQSIWGTKVSKVSTREFLHEKIFSIGTPLFLVFFLAGSIQIRLLALQALGLKLGQAASLPILIFEFLATSTYWTLPIAMLYKFLAPVKLHWKQVLPGSFITSVLMTAGRYFIGRYLMPTVVASHSGRVDDLLALLALLYYFSQVFLIGAELTHVLSRREC